MIRRALPLIVLIALSACNTVQGLGHDVKDAGQAITTGAQDAEKKM